MPQQHSPAKTMSSDPEHNDRSKLARGLNNRKLLDLVREAVLLVDLSGEIVFWNQGAEQLYGWNANEALGQSPLELLQTELPRPLAQIHNILRKERCWDAELKQTTRKGIRITVASRWALWRDDSGTPLGHFQLDSDITRRKQAEQELRVLSGRLLTIRDEERRRWARELHDSVGQLLVGVTMNPPMLDEVGLASALRWYVNGFSDRSQIKVKLEIPEALGRYRLELEIAVFRIVQEALSNVHRHSKSETAQITLMASPRHLRLKVEDRGKGMSLPISGLEKDDANMPGVGISGIRERVRQLGGQMQIRSGEWGTALEVFFPAESSSEAANFETAGA